MAQGQKSVTLHPKVIEIIQEKADKIGRSFSFTLNQELRKIYGIGYGFIEKSPTPAINPKADLEEIKNTLINITK